LKTALKDRAGVLEVLFGVGFGCGEARKRFVEQGDDSLLLGERRDWNRNQPKVRPTNAIARCACTNLGNGFEILIGLTVVAKESRAELLRIKADDGAVNSCYHSLASISQNATTPNRVRES
jgi:hypothetical protein